jgi:DNA-binding CsgD family transcriptional regulator
MNCIEDASLAALLDEIWACQFADVSKLLCLCRECVEAADRKSDAVSRMWARLSRVLLAGSYQDRAQSRDDLAVAQELASVRVDERANRLLKVCDAMLLSWVGNHGDALARVSALWHQHIIGRDDPDDFFVLHRLASAAAKVHDLEAMFSALYANLVITEKTGPPVRHAMVSSELAAALIHIGRIEQGLALVEARLGGAAEWRNDWLLGHMRINVATAKYLVHRFDDARAECEQLVRDGVDRLCGEFAYQIHTNLVGIAIALGDPVGAARHVTAAYDAAARLKRSGFLAVCHQAAGLIAHRQGDMPRAIEMLESALDCYETDHPVLVPLNSHTDAAEVLGACYAAQGKLEPAYGAHRRFFEIYRRRIEYTSRAQVHAVKAQQMAAARIPLTDRELECLSWSAAGKTAWEIGKILNLSEWTVVYHIEKTKKKFGVTRKQEVVAHAISLGLIKPIKLPTSGS